MHLRKILAAVAAVATALPWNAWALEFAPATDGAAPQTDAQAAGLAALGNHPALAGALGKLQDAAVAGIADKKARRHHAAILSQVRTSLTESLRATARAQNEVRGADAWDAGWAKMGLRMAAQKAKADAEAFKEALADARAASNGQDPYAVSADDARAVRAEILTWQKDLADWIESSLKAATAGRMSEGSAKFSLRAPGAELEVSMGKVSVLTAGDGAGQSARLAGSFSAAASGAQAPAGTGAIAVRGTFDVTVVTASGTTYLTVNDWGLEDRAGFLKAARAQGMEADAFLETLDQAKGVTLKMGADAGDELALQAPVAAARAAALVRVLRTVPAFGPAKAHDGKFLLAPETAFTTALESALTGTGASGATPDAEPFLWFSRDAAGASVEGSGDGASVRVTRDAQGYYQGWAKSDDGSFSASYSGGAFVLKAGGSPWFSADATWKNGALDASVSMMGMQAAASGALTRDRADLKLAFGGQPAGWAKWARDGNRSTLDLKVAPVLESGSGAAFEFSATADLTERASGDAVIAPKDARDAQEFFRKVSASVPSGAKDRDQARKAAVQRIAAALETYYQDRGSYPAKIDEEWMLDVLPKREFPSVAPGPNNACAAPFTYRRGDTRHKGDSFVVSSCVELPSNRAGALDGTKYELHVGDALETRWEAEQKIPAPASK